MTIIVASHSGSTPAPTSTTTTSSAITPQLLSSALSSVMQSSNTLSFLSPPQSSSGPSSLPSQQAPSENVDSGPASLPAYGRNNSDPGVLQVSQDDLSRALQSVLQVCVIISIIDTTVMLGRDFFYTK